MNADENRIARGISDLCAHFQRHKIIALASHHHAQSFGLQKRAQLSGRIEHKIFFISVTTHLAFVVPAMSRIQNDRFNLANV